MYIVPVSVFHQRLPADGETGAVADTVTDAPPPPPDPAEPV
jgi:hypothetical protein